MSRVRLHLILLIPGYESDKVYRVAETGEKQPIDATYYEDLGGAIFTIDHLSIYMVEDQSKQPEGKTCWLCWLVILILIIIILVIMHRCYRRSDE